MEHNSAINKNEVMTFADKWIESETAIVNKII